MRVVIAPDSFKGTMSSSAAARAMAVGVRRAWPDAVTNLLPLADGGEGTAEVLTTATGGQLRHCQVTGPLGTPVQAHLGLLGASKDTAIVEMAQAAGLGLVPVGQRDPRITTTFGVGEMIRSALECGVTELLVGLGGSATNDGGAGAMTALGAKFLDRSGHPLPSGGAALLHLDRIDLSGFSFPLKRISVAVLSDVTSPLTGPAGASFVYAAQKGADESAIAELDHALKHWAAVVRRDLGCDVETLPGAGAAGGLGAALAVFLGAKFFSGIDFLLDRIGFDALARNADLVLTGEGQIDQQTLSGKTILGLLTRCQAVGVPLIAFAGTVDAKAARSLRQQGLWDAISLVTKTVPKEEAMRDPERVLAETVERSISQAVSALPL